MDDYKIEIEIFEGKGGTLKKNGDEIVYPDLDKEGICAWMYRGDGCTSYQQGQKFVYPDDSDKLCSWLLHSIFPIVQTLRFGGNLPWEYAGTKYEKEMDPDSVTTEFVRCIDPTNSGIVVKIIRTKL